MQLNRKGKLHECALYTWTKKETDYEQAWNVSYILYKPNPFAQALSQLEGFKDASEHSRQP